jgi:hypothetical protein
MPDKVTEETALKNVMGDFLTSYTGRDTSIGFSDWLAGRLQQEMPDMSADTSERLSQEIVDGVAKYDHTLEELNSAIEAGQSKEEWLADRTMEACAGMPPDDAGGKLQQIYRDLNTANTELVWETEDAPESETAIADADEVVEWNKYSLKDKALNIGQQAIMSGLGAAADIMKTRLESGETTGVGEAIGEALQAGMETAKGEVKAVVAGAIKSAAEKGLTDFLPSDTPVESICDMAGVAVESAEALFDVASGKNTVVEGLDKIGRAGVAAGCRYGAALLKGALVRIPYVGPLVANLAGGLLDHMNGPKFAENVYTVVRDATVALWEGIKEKGRGIFKTIKNALFG